MRIAAASTQRWLIGIFCAQIAAGISVADDRAANDHFHGSAIPIPPEQKREWKPPGQMPIVEKVSQFLFREGMADPRGCEYRQIKVNTGSVWARYDESGNGIPAFPVQTHGWVLPANQNDKQRFAVCWNGWVYPVLAVGAPCSVEQDVAMQTAPAEKNEHDSNRSAWVISPTPSEPDSVAFDTALPVKAALLLRLGKPQLAAAVWEASGTGASFKDARSPTEPNKIFERIAVNWLFALYNRAICAWMRGDDDLALFSLRQLARITPEVKKTFKEDYSQGAPGPLQEDPFDFLYEVPAYTADAERRHKEPPRKTALELGKGRFADKQKWIEALIGDLENVCAPQEGQPGWVALETDPTVKALVEEGNEAVEPLLVCLEKDNRLTRSVHFWRDFARFRTVLGVNEAAYTALAGIFKTQFFSPMSTGQDLTNSDPESRAKVVAAIRAYWKERKDKSVEEQWFTTLADDGAKPEEWSAAAANIAQSGQSLRVKTNPSVTDLLKKRIASISRAPITDRLQMPPAPQIANALLKWSGNAEVESARALCNAMAARYSTDEELPFHYTNSLQELTDRVLAAGGTKILEDDEGWLRAIPPNKIHEDISGAATLWFKLLWEHPDVEAMQKTADFLFTNNDSKWLSFIHGNLGTNQVLEMVRSPLIGVPAFRQLLLAGLADKTQVGEAGYLETDFWIVRFGSGPQTVQVMAQLNPLDPLSKSPPRKSTFRACDLYAWGLAQAEGMPALEFYWPEEKRDAAIKATIQTLQHYGKRYATNPEIPPREESRHGFGEIPAQAWFARLDHPATAEEAEAGNAIFSLPPEAKARLWAMPKPPLDARWLALKDFSHTEGYLDARDRQKQITRYENSGRVWQAEEGLIDGQWKRFFGFVGDHCIARAPAEEIEFPAEFVSGERSWQELEGGFDCKLEPKAALTKPLRSGDPIAVTLKLRNRRGVDQDAPENLNNAEQKALAAGVEIRLYRKHAPAPAEIVKESHNPNDADWSEVAPRAKQSKHFDLPTPSHHLAPTEELQVMSCGLEDYYDFKAPGDYYIELTFDRKKLEFTGGVSNYIRFRVQ